MNGMEPSSFLH